MLTPGLVSLNIHEALTFDGTEIVLHPDLFSSSSNLPSNEASTSFGSSIHQQQQQQQHRRSTSIIVVDDKNGPRSDAVGGTADSAVVASHLLQAGDLIEIRVWDAVHKAAIQQSSSALPKTNASSVMRRRSSPSSANNNNNTAVVPQQQPVSNLLQLQQQSQIPSTATRDSEASTEATTNANASYMSATNDAPSTAAAADDATEPAAGATRTKVTESRTTSPNDASTIHQSNNNSAQNSLADTSTVDSGNHKDSVATPSSSIGRVDAILQTPGEELPPAKTVVTGTTADMPSTQSRHTAVAPATAPEASQTLPPKPPIPMRNRTTGSINPVVTDLFGSKIVSSSTGATNSAATLTSNNNNARPRHFRDLSDMTMDTVADFTITPNMTTTSEEEDDVWTQLSGSHTLRQSFCIMVSPKSLTSLKPSARTQVSILRPIAELYGLSSYDMVTIHKVDDESVWHHVSADFVLVTIKDQFISRGDMHYFVSNLIGSWVYEGQRLLDDTKNIQAHAKEIRHKDRHAYSGIITEQTKITFRSRSSRLIWLVQISLEMFDYASPYDVTSGEESRCETYFDKWIAFVKRLFAKWKEQETSHSLTVVFFSRTFIGSVPGERTPGIFVRNERNPAEHRDIYGRRYEDHFRLVVENATTTDLDSLVVSMKEAFVKYPAEVGWNSLVDEGSRRPSLASQGNVLEATNVTLNLLQFHYFDRDLNRTGNSLVIISAGNGVFEVDKDLAGITYQRMMDNGIGSDMLSLSLPPLHIAPFFLYTDSSSSSEVNDTDVASTWEVPHWLHLSFISYDREGSTDGTVYEQKESQINRFQVDTIAGLAVAANGFLLPASYPTQGATNAPSYGATPLRDGTEERQLIAGRDFRDILDACRPRHIGELPSVLKTLLGMYDTEKMVDSKITLGKLSGSFDDDDSAIEEWGALRYTSKCVDSPNRKLYRIRAVSLGQEPSLNNNSPKIGPVMESPMADGLGMGGNMHASSFDSLLSGSVLGVSYDRPFLAHAASPSLTGIQLQRSPSFRAMLAAERVRIEMNIEGEDSDTGENSPQKARLDEGIPSVRDLKMLMNELDASLVAQSLPGESPLISRTRDHSQGRHAPAQHVGSRSTIRAAYPSTGGLGGAISRYDGARISSVNDDNEAIQIAATKVGNLARSAGASYARRQFELTSRGMSPLLLPSVTDSDDNIDILSPAYRVALANNSLIHPLETKLSSALTSGRPFALSNASKSPPTSNSPTIPSIERNPRRASIESDGTMASDRRARLTSRSSRRRKAFNPFRQKDEDEVLAKKTHNRLRWTHVFPLGEIEFKRHAGPSWKSLSCPAILPLSVDYFPSQQEVDHNYTFSIYNVTRSEFEHTPYSSNIELMWEMVRQRLTQDYQLVSKDHPNVTNFRRETLGRADLDDSSSKVEKPGTIRVFLSMGYSLQILTYDPAIDVIEVTRYDAKDARTLTTGASSFKYLYLCFCPTTRRYLPVAQTFTKYSALYNWNKVDRIICGDDDREMREGMRFKRIMFAVLPERCENTGAENAYVEKFQRLIEYFEKLREKDAISEPFEVEIVRIHGDESRDEQRKRYTESTPGISWNAMRRFYVRLKKGKNDALEWMEIVVDSTFKTCWSYRIMFHWLVASSGKVEAQVQMLNRRCIQFGLKLVPFPQLSVTKDVYLYPFKANVAIKLESKDAVDRLDEAIDKLDYLHDGVFYTDAQDIKECVPSDFDFGRRWSQTIAGRQFVHRSGTVFIRILTELKGRAIVYVFNNHNYLGKDDKAKPTAQAAFDALSDCIAALSNGTWEGTPATERKVLAGEKPMGAEQLDTDMADDHTLLDSSEDVCQSSIQSEDWLLVQSEADHRDNSQVTEADKA